MGVCAAQFPNPDHYLTKNTTPRSHLASKIHTRFQIFSELRGHFPQGPHSHILLTGGSDIFYTSKNPNFRICLPQKIRTFFSIPKKIPQCFCISKFYYLSSGKLKHANFNFGFGQKQNYELRLCYC